MSHLAETVLLCLFFSFTTFKPVHSINCYQCSGTDSDNPFECTEFLGNDIDLAPTDCATIHNAQYCIKHVGRFEGVAIECYQCNSSETMECGDGLMNLDGGVLKPTSCEHVHNAQHCIKQTGTEQFDEQQGTRGDLIIGLKFELQDSSSARGKGTLHVLVKEAKNLVATKPTGLADVFCKSYLLPERGRLAKQKTNVSRRTLNPRWEHTFVYRGLTLQELGTRALELSLWDRDRLASNDFMGAIRLSLGTGTYMGASVNWMDSMGKEVTLWQTMMQRPNFWVEGSLPLRPQLNN